MKTDKGTAAPFLSEVREEGRWNKAPVSRMPYWREFPLFDLRFQTPEDAREYLKKVRQVLGNRVKACEQKLVAYRKGVLPRPPGRKYQERLRAFLQWCILAQGVCKYWMLRETKIEKDSQFPSLIYGRASSKMVRLAG